MIEHSTGSDMSSFSVVLLTAVPAHLGAQGIGAFVKVDGRECLLRTVELFLNRDNVKQIQLVVMPESMEESKRKYGAHLGFSAVKLLAGGPNWIDQIAVAGQTISAESTHVLLHDAARPAVAYADIDALMAEAQKRPAVALSTELRGGLAELDESGKPIDFRLPQRFLQVVTPWVMKKDRFVEIAKTKRDLVAGELTLLRGSPLNLRVGGGSDAGMVKTMIAMLPKPKIKAADNPFEEAQW
jgi:2-C-methyl-D-erythritol 4-phosphate cytidylyltransferase